MNNAPRLSPRFAAAFTLANELHAGQQRKGTEIPYVAHLLAVAALVIEHGGDEDAAIAALLHDAVEDQGGAQTLERIRIEFGDGVAEVVAACSDAQITPKPPWEARKRAYLAAIPHRSEAALLVSIADKLHNARAILADYRLVGEALWQRFNGGREGTLWYYRALVEGYRGRTVPALWQALAEVVSEIEGRARSS